MFRQPIACHPQGALMILAKITINMNIPVVDWPVHVPSCTWKQALNTQHTPIHDMLPHPLHYWNVHVHSDFS